MDLEIKAKVEDEAAGTWYVPRFGGNREKPAEEQAEVLVLPVTTDQMKAIRRSVPGTRSTDATKAEEDRNDAVVRKTLQTRLAGFKRWNVLDENGNRSEIKTSIELVKTIARMDAMPAGELTNELFAAITDGQVLEEGARKN